MVQYARPDADDTDGNWVNESGNSNNLYASVDEASADDDTTQINSTDEGSGDDACILRLSDVSTPAAGSAFIKYKAVTQDNAGMGSGPSLKMELLQGSTSKATFTNTGVETDGSTYTNYSHEISDVSGISDWTDLKIRLTMVSTSGFGDVMYVTQVFLETQDAAGAAAPVADPDLPGAAFLMFID